MTDHDPGLGSGNSSFTRLVGMTLGLVILCSVLGNVMPVSCSKMLPFVGKKYKDYCDACGGDGKADKTCRECLGRGYFSGHSCTACSKTGKIEETCRFCGGSGKKPKD